MKLKINRNPTSLFTNNSLFFNVAASIGAPNENITSDPILHHNLSCEYDSDQLLTELSIEFSSDLNIPQQTLLQQIKKERELFIAVTKLTNYQAILLNKYEGWHDDSGPYRLFVALEHTHLAVIYEELEATHLFEASSDSLFKEVEKQTKKILKKLKEHNETDLQSIENQTNELFFNLLSNPSSFSKDELQAYLSSFCSLNASHLLHTICRKAPSKVDLNLLLSTAMRNLNYETVKVLVGLGADINATVLLFKDWDKGIKITGPILFYPFFPLMLERYGQFFLKIPRSIGPAFFRIDHPKLINIMSYLLHCGANIEQKIVTKHYDPYKKKQSEEPVINDENSYQEESIYEFSQLLLSEDLLKLSTPEFSQFADKMANWTSNTEFQHHSPTSEELESYVKWVGNKYKELEEADKAKQNLDPATEECEENLKFGIG